MTMNAGAKLQSARPAELSELWARGAPRTRVLRGEEKPWLPRRCRGGVLMEDQSEPWDELWARLSTQGWRHERHPRPRDHLFLPPGVDRTDPNAVLRRHYFDSVRSFVSLSDATAVKDEPSDTPVRARPQAARPTAMLRPCSEGKSGPHSAALVASAARSAAFRKRPRRLGPLDSARGGGHFRCDEPRSRHETTRAQA